MSEALQRTGTMASPDAVQVSAQDLAGKSRALLVDQDQNLKVVIAGSGSGLIPMIPVYTNQAALPAGLTYPALAYTQTEAALWFYSPNDPAPGWYKIGEVSP